MGNSDKPNVVRDEGGNNRTYSRRSSHSSSSHHHRNKTSFTRNEHCSWPRHPQIPFSTSTLLILILLTCCISLSSAQSYYIDEQMIEELEAETSEDLGSALSRLAKSGTILVDQGPPPGQVWTLATEFDDLNRRAVEHSSSSSSSSDNHETATSSSISSMITTASTTATRSGTKTSSTNVAAATTVTNSPLPSPFDQGFSGNITDSCQSFMDGMLGNASFKSCLPFSLLLQNSNSFFQASKSLVRMSQTLDATCAADLSTCSPLMSSFASNLTTSTACASDLNSQNPLITQAQLGLLAYKPLYTASCLRNPSTSSYCFADAVTNTSSPTDSYIYYLPLNISLPGGSQPTCDSCLKNTMAIFASTSSDRTSALASDYVDAAMQVNVQCGPSFVNASLPSAATSAAGMESANPAMGVLALALLVGSWIW